MTEASEGAEVVSPATSQAPLIDWKPGCENELHAAVLSRLNDMTGAHLKRVAKTAISGPSQLDFLFPANYDLDRRLCDRPEVVSRLEQIVFELVGKRVRIRFHLTDAVAAELKAAPTSAKVPAKSRVVEETDDPYLQEMMDVFGIKGWKMQSHAADDKAGAEG